MWSDQLLLKISFSAKNINHVLRIGLNEIILGNLCILTNVGIFNFYILQEHYFIISFISYENNYFSIVKIYLELIILTSP